MNLVFLGPPGSGKGTVAQLAKERMNVVHISTGRLFRTIAEEPTTQGRLMKDLLAHGDLVPDELTIEVVKQTLQQPEMAQGYILDGFPRTLAQAQALATLADIDHVIYLNIGEDEVLKRLSGRRTAPSSGRVYHIIYNPPRVDGIDDETGEPLVQRDDDTPEAILHRLEIYEKQTEPLIDFYKELGLLRTIDGHGTPDEVYERLIKTVG